MTDLAPPARHDFATISLGAIQESADLQKRRDRKYIVSDEAALDVLAALDLELQILEIDGRRDFRYSTVYFDTPDTALYLQAARRRPRRAKVRIRRYLDSNLAMLEVKTRNQDGGTEKFRLPRDPERPDQLDDDDLAWIVQHDPSGTTLQDLSPTLDVRYRRVTFYAPGSDSRLTLDHAIQMTDADATGSDNSTTRRRSQPTSVRKSLRGRGPLHAPGHGARLHGLAILETKSNGRRTAVDLALWRLGHRRDRISKYCVGLAVLRPDLPANAWHRTITHHVAPRLRPLTQTS